ncbi:SGF29 C-terminal domain-containing protein [Lachancea thermotolerans]|uniref:KLTH0H12298p n=1 Tax=Lachancea thermotolerans (strain ATCC 56472 / CBS 6340 / NRRL Y-8284) TaxID=559295 RepID=C5E3C9_LACTC|nr:KLTH0H12298p [Lachancea thermotolerans CBS 6340]CAR30540.1 KLTH0H12298p [Lachancea thermotolerans CBS 6340]
MDDQWDVVVSSLQELLKKHETTSFDDLVNEKRLNFHNLSSEQLLTQLESFTTHSQNLEKAIELIETISNNLNLVIKYVQENTESAEAAETKTPSSSESYSGRSYWTSPYNPSEPIVLESEVAYRPKKGGDGEWFQCQVIKISSDGTRFEVRDPEPDELGNPGQMYKCNWKDVILIPARSAPKHQTPNYPSGTKVLARYPETTTFYPAVVIGHKRDGTCKLRFDGEEEVDKETEVARRLVLPFPARR